MLRIPKKTLEDGYLLEDFQHDFTALQQMIEEKSSSGGSSVKNVRDYGITGSHLDNNTTQIKKLINEGGEIYFPAGTYNLHETVTIPSNTTIICDKDVLFVRKHYYNMIETKTTKDTTSYNGANNVTIIGGTFQHDGDTGTGDAFVILHADTVNLHNVTIKDVVGGSGVAILGSKNVNITSCILTGYSGSTADLNEGIKIEPACYYNSLRYSSSDATFDLTPSENILIENCIIYSSTKNKTYPLGIGARLQYALKTRNKNITIRNNKIEGDAWYSSCYGIKCTSYENILIEGNTIIGHKNSIGFDIPGKIYNADGSTLIPDGVSYQDEDMYGVASKNIFIKNNILETDKDNWTPRGCIWLNIAEKAITDSGSNVPKYRNVFIEGNMLHCLNTKTHQYAIELEATEEAFVANNIIKSAHSDTWGVYVLDYSKNVTVGVNRYENIQRDKEFFIKENAENIKKIGRTKLWSGSAYSSNTNMNLTYSMSHFDVIMFEYDLLGYNYKELNIASGETQSLREFNLADSATSKTIMYGEIRVKKNTDTQIVLNGNKTLSSDGTIKTDDSTCKIYSIYGINYQ